MKHNVTPDNSSSLHVVIYVLLTMSIASGSIGIVGCGSSSHLENNDILWPPPPDEPRIMYVKTYQNEDHFTSGFGKFTQAIAGKTGRIQLMRPFDVCVDGDSRLYVTDIEQGLLVFDEGKQSVYAIGERSTIPIEKPLGVGCGNGKVFVGLPGVGQVVALSAREGTLVGVYGRPGQFSNPLDVVYDHPRRRVVIADNKQHQVFVYDESGDSLFTFGGNGEEDGEFNYPQSVAIDTAGFLYVVDAMNFRVQVFDASGRFVRKYGQQGNIYGTFARPKGISLDSHGNVYVADALHNNVQIFNNSFELLMFFGRYAHGTNLGFENPVGVFIDPKNTIYVADQLNQRVQVFQLLRGD